METLLNIDTILERLPHKRKSGTGFSLFLGAKKYDRY